MNGRFASGSFTRAEGEVKVPSTHRFSPIHTNGIFVVSPFILCGNQNGEISSPQNFHVRGAEPEHPLETLAEDFPLERDAHWEHQ